MITTSTLDKPQGAEIQWRNVRIKFEVKFDYIQCKTVNYLPGTNEYVTNYKDRLKIRSILLKKVHAGKVPPDVGCCNIYTARND